MSPKSQKFDTKTLAYLNQSAIYLFIYKRVKLIVFNVNINFEIFLAGV